MNMKKIRLVVCILVVAFSFETQQVSARRVSEIGMPVCQSGKDLSDFVHDVSAFDICYPVFRAIATGNSHYVDFLNGRGTPYGEQFMHVGEGWHGPSYAMALDWWEQAAANVNNADNRNNPYLRTKERCVKFLRIFRETMLRDTAYDEAAEKLRLVRQMETFRDTAHVLPTIFGTIKADYDGDVGKYVDALYRRSVLTGNGAMRRFRLNPSVGRMQRDMGFQFVVSKLMYRLWEAQGRPSQPAAGGTRLVVLRSELEKR